MTEMSARRRIMRTASADASLATPRAPGAPVRIASLASAVPRFAITQDAAEALAAEVFRDRPRLFERLRPAFANAGVARRYSCVPLSWYRKPHGWKERHRLYVENATALIEGLARTCAARAGVALGEIDAVVVASTTGIATPSLDALVIERLGLRRNVARLPIFGLGCAGGVLGLARAAQLARATPGAAVLFLVVELCGLTFLRRDRSKSNIIATALFGDGAAGAVLTTGPRGPTGAPALTGWAEHTWPASLDVMGWRVEDDGLAVVFSRDIPALVRGRMREAAAVALAAQGLSLGDIDGFVCHPGGAKVIAALEEAFGLEAGALAEARAVLRDYGNMSAPSVFFVLERTLARPGPRPRRLLLSALGPGFTAGFATLET